MKRNSFAYRHIGPKPLEVTEMLQTIGAESLDALIDQTVPEAFVSEAKWILRCDD